MLGYSWPASAPHCKHTVCALGCCSVAVPCAHPSLHRAQQVGTWRGRAAVTQCIPKIHAVERAPERVRCLSRTKARREFLGQRAASVRIRQEPPAHACLQLLAALWSSQTCLCVPGKAAGVWFVPSSHHREQSSFPTRCLNTFPAPSQLEGSDCEQEAQQAQMPPSPSSRG